jgi:O-antigen ligase
LIVRGALGRAERVPSPGAVILVPLAAWAAWAVASLAWSVHPDYSLGELKREVGWNVATMMIFYVAAQQPRSARLVVGVGLATFAVLGALALALTLSAKGWNPERWHAGVGSYSTFLVLVAPMLFTLLAPASVGLGNGRWRITAAAALLALLLVAARLTDNRMVWIALAAVFATAAALGSLRWRASSTRARVRWAAPLLALLLVLGVLFADAAREKARLFFPPHTTVGETLKQDPRLALWDRTAARIAERPWLGYGFGKSILEDELRGELRDPTLTHAHNLFASQWLQTGAPGLAAFVALLGALLWRYAGFLRARDDALAFVGMVGIALVAGFVVKNLTDDFLVRANAREFWALAALLLGTGVRLARAGESVTR